MCAVKHQQEDALTLLITGESSRSASEPSNSICTAVVYLSSGKALGRRMESLEVKTPMIWLVAMLVSREGTGNIWHMLLEL